MHPLSRCAPSPSPAGERHHPRPGKTGSAVALVN